MKDKFTKNIVEKKINSQEYGQSVKEYLLESLSIEIPKVRIFTRLNRSVKTVLMRVSRPKFFDFILVPLFVSFLVFVIFLVLTYLTHFNK